MSTIEHIIRQLWRWIALEYDGSPENQKEVDSKNFGYGLTYKDIRLAKEMLDSL